MCALEKNKTAQKGWYLVVAVATAMIPASHMLAIGSSSEQYLQPILQGMSVLRAGCLGSMSATQRSSHPEKQRVISLSIAILFLEPREVLGY